VARLAIRGCATHGSSRVEMTMMKSEHALPGSSPVVWLHPSASAFGHHFYPTHISTPSLTAP